MGFPDDSPLELLGGRNDMEIPVPATGSAAYVVAVADAESESEVRQRLGSYQSLEWQIVPLGQLSRL